MPRFEPFAALRYAATDLSPLVAPPYDVLSDGDLAEFQARSPLNVVHVDVPRGGEDRYLRAAETFQHWRAGRILVPDPTPSLTIYRMSFVAESGTQREIAGVVGGLEVVDEGAGGVLPHERTTPRDSTDRLELTRATEANLSPVWGLSLATGLTGLLREPAEPLGCVVEDGVEHRVERVTDPERIAAVQELLATDDLLIADGHHRYGVSRAYRDEVRAATRRRDTPAELTLAFVSELAADQLSVDAIHRLYTGITPVQLAAALARRFDFESTSRPTAQTLSAMAAEEFLVLVERNSAWKLTPKPGAFDDVRSLDGAWLEATLEGTAVSVGYQHGLAETLAEVDAGRAAAAVVIRPVSVAEIERTAREGLLMPPKSTFFTPKLKTGFVIRPLDVVEGAG